MKNRILLSADTPSAISKSMGLVLIGFADYFKRINPDLLIVLGDRYETLAVSMAAVIKEFPLPIFTAANRRKGLLTSQSAMP